MTTETICYELTDIPTQPHFAIITETSVHIPGDERSRQFPGHGYPAETRHFLKYTAFTDRGEWLDKITDLTKERPARKFRAVEVKPMTVRTEVMVTVSPILHEYTKRCPECVWSTGTSNFARYPRYACMPVWPQMATGG